VFAFVFGLVTLEETKRKIQTHLRAKSKNKYKHTLEQTKNQLQAHLRANQVTNTNTP
jgi:hypothetical protein